MTPPMTENEQRRKKALGPKNGPITATYHEILTKLLSTKYTFQTREELCTKRPFVVFVIFIVCDVSCVSNSVPIFAGLWPFNTEKKTIFDFLSFFDGWMKFLLHTLWPRERTYIQKLHKNITLCSQLLCWKSYLLNSTNTSSLLLLCNFGLFPSY